MLAYEVGIFAGDITEVNFIGDVILTQEQLDDWQNNRFADSEWKEL